MILIAGTLEEVFARTCALCIVLSCLSVSVLLSFVLFRFTAALRLSLTGLLRGPNTESWSLAMSSGASIMVSVVVSMLKPSYVLSSRAGALRCFSASVCEDPLCWLPELDGRRVMRCAYPLSFTNRSYRTSISRSLFHLKKSSNGITLF